MAQFGKVEIADAEVARLTDRELTQRLIAEGVSRLTAARVVEIARSDEGAVGRARPHTTSRRP